MTRLCGKSAAFARVGRGGAFLAFAVFFCVSPCCAATIRTRTDMRLWETVTDRTLPLSWPWDAAADSASLVFSNRLDKAVSSVGRVIGRRRAWRWRDARRLLPAGAAGRRWPCRRDARAEGWRECGRTRVGDARLRFRRGWRTDRRTGQGYAWMEPLHGAARACVRPGVAWRDG